MLAAPTSGLASRAYRVEAQAGRGASAEVLRAVDPNGRAVALKVAAAADGLAREALAREASYAALAPSQALPELVDAGWIVIEGDVASVVEANATGARPFLALAWAEGRPASELVGRATLALALASRGTPPRRSPSCTPPASPTAT